jgi:hypothetical protein
MPMLLATSGMLAARRISEGWSRPGAAVRVASSYYLYVVWLALYFAFDLPFSSVNLNRIASMGDFLTQLFVPETTLWFIFALALYVVVLTSVRRVPPWFVLGALAALSVAAGSSDPQKSLFWTVLQNAVFFAAGVYGGRLLQALAARRRIRDLLIATMVALGSVVLAKWRVGAVGDGLEHIFFGVVCIVLAAAFFPHVVRWRPLAVAGNFVGRRTLQIYLLHPPLMLLLLVLLNHAGTDLARWRAAQPAGDRALADRADLGDHPAGGADPSRARADRAGCAVRPICRVHRRDRSTAWLAGGHASFGGHRSGHRVRASGRATPPALGPSTLT